MRLTLPIGANIFSKLVLGSSIWLCVFLNTDSSWFCHALAQLFSEFFDPHDDDGAVMKEDILRPIIIWWTGFTGEPGHYKICGEHQCFFTIDKHYYHHPKAKVCLYCFSLFQLDNETLLVYNRIDLPLTITTILPKAVDEIVYFNTPWSHYARCIMSKGLITCPTVILLNCA